MRRSLAVTATAVLCVLAALVGSAAAADNAPPLPDAGLDQTIDADATVHLNANGSRDPDGSLAGVRWTVETPDGRTTAPDCPTCRQTTFDPSTTGRYEVTLSVTDDDGATRSDTLFVDVQSTAGPSVTVSGPSTADWNRSTTLTADVDAGDASLSSIAWVVDGGVIQRDSLSGDSATATLSTAYTASGSVSVRAVVYDRAGRRATATHSLTALTDGSDGGGGNGGATSGDDECHFWNNDCLNDEVLVNPMTGEERVVEANGDEGIQVNTENGWVNVRDVLSGDQLDEYRLANGDLDADVIDRIETEVLMDNAVVDTSTGGDNTKNGEEGNGGGDEGNDHTNYWAGSYSSSGGSYKSDSGTTIADVVSGGDNDDDDDNTSYSAGSSGSTGSSYSSNSGTTRADVVSGGDNDDGDDNTSYSAGSSGSTGSSYSSNSGTTMADVVSG